MKLFGKILFGWIVFCAVAAVGALIVRKRVPDFGEENDDRFSLVAAMGGRVFRSTSDALIDGSALACMGGIELDLTEAAITDTATLKLTAIMGGIDVTVPHRGGLRSHLRLSWVASTTLRIPISQRTGLFSL